MQKLMHDRSPSFEKFLPTRVSMLVSRDNPYWLSVSLQIGYEYSKRWFAKHYAPNNLPIWTLLASGAIGGVSYWLACYPLDVVKSRVQMAKLPPSKGGWLSGGYVAREMSAIVKEGGVSSLFRGIGPSLVRAVPAAGATFAAYEVARGKSFKVSMPGKALTLCLEYIINHDLL